MVAGELGTRWTERTSEVGDSGVGPFGKAGVCGGGCRSGASSSLDSKAKMSRIRSVSGDTEDLIDRDRLGMANIDSWDSWLTVLGGSSPVDCWVEASD